MTLRAPSRPRMTTVERPNEPQPQRAKPLICPALEELGRAFDGLAFPFKREMPMPVITIQTRGRRKRALGWFSDQKWKNGKPQGLPEINICAERLETVALSLHKNPGSGPCGRDVQQVRTALPLSVTKRTRQSDPGAGSGRGAGAPSQ